MNMTTVVLIGYVWPEPTSSAAGLRDLSLIEDFQKQGWRVIFASQSKESEFSAALVARGVEIKVVAANDPAFDSWIKDLQPDYVIFDRFMIEEQFGWRVQENSPNAVRVLDTIDLHFLRRARMAALEEGKPLSEISDASIDLETDDALREIAAIYRSDLTFILSDFETTLLRDRFQVSPEHIFLHRFSYPKPEAVIPTFQDRRDFVMIGNFRHPPNKDAVLWMKKEVWPIMRRLMNDRNQKPELHIYGAYPGKDVMSLDRPSEGFRVLGWAKDQYAALRKYRVDLAPLRFGAGIKGKISDGWWTGTPVVTTPIGAEGMHGDFSFPGIIGRSADELAALALSLYDDEVLWTENQKRGWMLLRELYDPESNARSLIGAMTGAKEHLGSRRSANFIGKMLNHHQHKSTKYFSKWIEQKNIDKLKSASGELA